MAREIKSPSVNALIVLLLFILLSGSSAQPASAQVFCRSQFALANEACSLKIYPGEKPAFALHDSSSSSSSHDNGEQQNYELQDGGGGHHHRRRRQKHPDGDPYDTACCRRLMGIDNACICQALSRLPLFMTKVKHVVKLTPIPGCDVAFECTAV